MTTFTWNPATLGPYQWNTASDWLPATVPIAADADVVIPPITQGDNPYYSMIQIAGGQSYAAGSLSMTNTDLEVLGTLAVSSGLTLTAGAAGETATDLGGSLSLGSLDVGSHTYIRGYGQITSPNSIDNGGAIMATSEPGLTLSVAGLRNDGTLGAQSGTLDVSVTGGAAAFANLNAGTLNGGSFQADAGGVLLLDVSGNVSTDAADIEYVGDSGAPAAPPRITTAGTNIAATLASIATGGTLGLLNDEALTLSHALSISGLVTIDQSTLAAPGATIAPSGTLTGDGTLTAPITNNGLLNAAYSSFFGSNFLLVSGALTGSGSISIAARPGTLPGRGGVTLELGAGGSGTVAFADNFGVLILDSPEDFAGTIHGFTVEPVVEVVGPGGPVTFDVSNTIILSGISIDAITGKQYNGDATAGTLTLQEASGSIALQFNGSYDLGDFMLAAGPQVLSSSPPSIEITEVAPCFVAGTRIRTMRGEIPVERLRIGDELPNRTGATSALRWIGHRHLHCATHPRPSEVLPIRVHAGAFAAATPSRDVLLSPDHAVWVDGVLIPVRYLVNGASIVREHRAAVTYWHLELPSYGIILAEGLPCESYLDTGNRARFDTDQHRASGAIQYTAQRTNA